MADGRHPGLGCGQRFSVRFRANDIGISMALAYRERCCRPSAFGPRAGEPAGSTVAWRAAEAIARCWAQRTRSPREQRPRKTYPLALAAAAAAAVAAVVVVVVAVACCPAAGERARTTNADRQRSSPSLQQDVDSFTRVMALSHCVFAEQSRTFR